MSKKSRPIFTGYETRDFCRAMGIRAPMNGCWVNIIDWGDCITSGSIHETREAAARARPPRYVAHTLYRIRVKPKRLPEPNERR